MERKRSRRALAREKTFGQRCRDYMRQFIAFIFSNVGIIGLVVGYTVAGAFMFKEIENNQETFGNREVGRLRNETAARLWNYTNTLNVFVESETTWQATVEQELEVYQRKIVEAIKDLGYDGSENMKQEWTFPGAFLYSLTVITTIGYGNVTPRTVWGKVATIFYAIAGMPLFLLYLSNIGDILARSFKWLYARCCLCKCCPKKRKKTPPVVATALKTLVPHADVYPPDARLQRGNSDRGPTGRNPAPGTRLQGSLSMEDGVNIEKGRRELDGFGRRFKPAYDREVGDAFNERNRVVNRDEEVYDSHLNRAKVAPIRRSSSTGEVHLPVGLTSDSLRRGVLAGPTGADDPRLARGGSEKLRRVLTRQDEVTYEMGDLGVRNGYRRGTEKDLGLTKAELILGMNDKGLEYLDLPKKRGPLQRVFGKAEGGRLAKPEVIDLGVNRYESVLLPPRGGVEGMGTTRSASVRGSTVVEAVTSDEESDDEGSGGSEESDGEFDSQTVTVPVSLCLAIMVGYVCGGAVLFSSWEDWNFLDGSYFCFISLSTIGFGDIVPGDKIYQSEGFDLSFIFCSMYLMLGMALIAMCFNLMQEEVVHKMRSCMSSLRNCLGCVRRSVLPSR